MTQRHGEIRFAAEIASDPDRIWSVIRDFGRVADWSPIASSSRLVAGVNASPGAERELLTADGTAIRERLLSLDDSARSLEYEMLSFPIPVTEQHNRITVEGTSPGSSLVSFVARFVPSDNGSVAQIAAINRDVFVAAAAGIGRMLDAAVLETVS